MSRHVWFMIKINVRFNGILYDVRSAIFRDVRAREGNSRKYWPVNSSRTRTILEFQKIVKNSKLNLYKVHVSGYKTKYSTGIFDTLNQIHDKKLWKFAYQSYLTFYLFSNRSSDIKKVVTKSVVGSSTIGYVLLRLGHTINNCRNILSMCRVQHYRLSIFLYTLCTINISYFFSPN
jgi:hypothetical protein